MSLRLAGPALATAAALVLFYLVCLSALHGFVNHRAMQEHTRWAEGVAWDMTDANALVGQAPVAAANWRFLDQGLEMEATGGNTYLSLEFSGQTLPAKRLILLELDLELAQSNVLKLFYRSALSRPPASSAPIRLEAGRQLLRLDLSALNWTSPDNRKLPWGQASASVATLRLHPAAAGPGRMLVHAIRLLPRPGLAAERPHYDATLSRLAAGGLPSPAIVTIPASSVAPPAWWRTLSRRLAQQLPGTTVESASALGAPNYLGAWALLILVTLVCGRIWRRWAAQWIAAGLALAVFAALWPLNWSLPAIGVLVVMLVAAAVAAPAVRWAWLGRRPAWIEAAGWTLVFMAPVLLLRWLPGWSGTGVSLDELNPWYPLWALAQQALLCAVFWPLSRRITRSVAWRMTGCALLFGWVHLANFELMVLSTALAFVALGHFRRHRALVPLAAMHAIAGLVWLNGLPRVLLYSGQVGAHYWS